MSNNGENRVVRQETVKAKQPKTLTEDAPVRVTEPQEDITAAQEAIKADRDNRVKKCGEAVKTALERYRCELHTVQEYIDGMPKAPSQVIIVAV